MSDHDQHGTGEQAARGRIDLSAVSQQYEVGGEVLQVLDGVDLTVEAGEALAIVGPSGSGKSTLLHLMGTLEVARAGRVEVSGVDPSALEEPALARFRNREIGFVFQDHHLLPQHSVLQNVLLPVAAQAGANGDETRARSLLEGVGLGARMSHRPAQLSGGERQRAAIARALINQPGILLCDEPTGNLDQETARAVGTMLFDLQREHGTTLVVVTHSMELASQFPRVIVMGAGGFVSDGPATEAAS